MRLRSTCAALAIACAALPVSARWPGDPSENMLLCSRPDMQYLTQVVTTSDNGWYVSWIDKSGYGYDIYLQRFDAAGNARWPEGGILVVDHFGQSIHGYDLAVDGQDHAIIAYHNVIDDLNQILATRISPAGELLWGEDGVQLTDAVQLDYVCQPCITATDDNAIVAAWSHGLEYTTEEMTIEMQRLSLDGEPLWDSLVTISDEQGASFWLCDLHASGGGTVIASWVRHHLWEDPRHIWAQKFDSDGQAQWNRGLSRGGPHLVVFDGGSIQYGCFPAFATDGSGGAVFAWYRTYPGWLQVFAQHVLADGTELFGHNGTAVSTAPRERVSPTVAFNPDTQETFIFWREHIYGDLINALYGQMLNPSGVRQWGDAGVEILPGAEAQLNDIVVLPCPEGVMALWVIEPQWAHCYVDATRLDRHGEFVWDPPIAAVSSLCADKDHLAAALNGHGVAAAAWADDRNGDRYNDRDVYAQSINLDGVCGVRPGDVDGDGAVGVVDLVLLINDWDCTGVYCPGDLSQDGVTAMDDLLILINDWG